MAERFLEQAKQENKLVLLDFGAPWCSTCKVLDRALENAWARLDSRVLWVKVDIHERSDLVERFQVLSVPTVIVLSPREEVLWRKSSNFQVQELEAALAQTK